MDHVSLTRLLATMTAEEQQLFEVEFGHIAWVRQPIAALENAIRLVRWRGSRPPARLTREQLWGE